MKKLLLATALALSSCGPIDHPNTDSVVIASDKALIICHNAYQTAAAAATAAVNAGLIRGSRLQRLSELNTQAKALLDKADQGEAVATNVSDALSLIAEMQSITGDTP